MGLFVHIPEVFLFLQSVLCFFLKTFIFFKHKILKVHPSYAFMYTCMQSIHNPSEKRDCGPKKCADCVIILFNCMFLYCENILSTDQQNHTTLHECTLRQLDWIMQ